MYWLNVPFFCFMQRFQGGDSDSCLTYRELHLIILISGYKRPPPLDPFLLEDRNGGQFLLISDQLQGTLLGRLSAAREPIQVQLNRTWVCSQSEQLYASETSEGHIGTQPQIITSPRKSSAEKWSASHTCSVRRGGILYSVSSQENMDSFFEMTIFSSAMR